jgi:hypothetical protein
MDWLNGEHCRNRCQGVSIMCVPACQKDTLQERHACHVVLLLLHAGDDADNGSDFVNASSKAANKDPVSATTAGSSAEAKDSG